VRRFYNVRPSSGFTFRINTKQVPARRTAPRQKKLSFGAAQVRLAVATHEGVLHKNSVPVAVEIVLVNAQRDPSLADAAL